MVFLPLLKAINTLHNGLVLRYDLAGQRVFQEIACVGEILYVELEPIPAVEQNDSRMLPLLLTLGATGTFFGSYIFELWAGVAPQ